MSFGVLATGFAKKSLAECKTELEAAFKSLFGASIDVSPQSNFGQLIGIMAEREADLWDLGEAVYSAFAPDFAIGAALDDVCAITGTIREPARASTVTLTATGTAGTVLPSGRTVSVATVGTRFDTFAGATITAVAAWQATHVYALGARVYNGGTSRVYQVITPGTSAGVGGPTSTSADITDNTVHWRYLGDGRAAIDVATQAELTGPRVAASGTLTVIETPVSGWQGAINVLDATPGADLESDPSLRIRREDEIRSEGNAALDAIRAKVLQVVGVFACTVFENPTDTIDADGLTPHSVEVLARGGADADIRAAIFGSVAAGIATNGGVSGTVTDADGISHTVKFSRPTEKNVYIVVDLTYDAALWPDDGAAQVQTAIVAWGDLQKTGKDVVAAAIVAQTFTVAGLLDATAKIGLAPAPATSVTIAIAPRELAVYDTSRITVNATPGTP